MGGGRKKTGQTSHNPLCCASACFCGFRSSDGDGRLITGDSAAAAWTEGAGRPPGERAHASPPPLNTSLWAPRRCQSDRLYLRTWLEDASKDLLNTNTCCFFFPFFFFPFPFSPSLSGCFRARYAPQREAHCDTFKRPCRRTQTPTALQKTHSELCTWRKGGAVALNVN